MSERKTAEIKFRVSPTEKAAWQADAERLETPLSELIRTRMNAAHDLEPQKRPYVAPALELCVCPLGDDCLGDGPSCLAAASPQEDVSTSDEVGAKASVDAYEQGFREGAGATYPWQFRG